MKKYKGSETILIADVDCTAEGKDLCSTIGVQGYPTIKYGDPGSLEKYEGGRSYADLEKFAKTLKPSCSPSNIQLCDETQKAEIEKLQELSAEELKTQIDEGEAAIKAAEKTFEDELAKLQATFKQLQATKEADIAKIKSSGLSLKKSVRNLKVKSKKKADKDEL